MKNIILIASTLAAFCAYSHPTLAKHVAEDETHIERSKSNSIDYETPIEKTQIAKAPQKIAAPRGPLEARNLLKRAFIATEENRIAQALPLFEAILQSDLLSDEGLANLYWTVADQRFRMGQIEGHFDALGQYLVAESLVIRPAPDPRVVIARSVLNARKVATRPRFGRSKDRAIEIVDARELPSIVSALPCGKDGSGRFIETKQARIDDVERDRTLVHHQSQCNASKATISLWFDVTHMR